MALITYAGLSESAVAFRTTVQLPAQGAWRICCETEQQIPLGSQATLIFRDKPFKGTVTVSEQQVHTYHVDIRPGAGMQKTVKEGRGYSSGAVASMIKEAVSAAGEKFSTASILPAAVKDWFRFPGQTLPQILGQLGVKWHCLASGEVIVGEIWPEVEEGESYFLSSHPQAGLQQIMLEPDAFIWPSASIKAVEYTAKADDNARCVVLL